MVVPKVNVPELRSFEARWLPELMGWFTDAAACRSWGGPRFRYPFTPDTFSADAMLDMLPSHGLWAEGRLVGFGQYYARLNCCHLGRLAVAPSHRRRGYGRRLVRALYRCGRARLGTARCSLFVLPDNRPALALYRALGFEETPYPGDPADAAGCLYLVAARLAPGGEGD